MTPSAVARYVHLSLSTVIGMLDRLEAKGSAGGSEISRTAPGGEEPGR